MIKSLENRYPEIISLNGDWDFTYTIDINEKENLVIPKNDKFTAKMPVPGYWDDNISKIQKTEFWETAKFNPDYRRIDFPMGNSMAPDASLPFLLGVGWYKKTFDIPVDWEDREVVLNIGGVLLEAWIWINGKLIKYHLGHSTSFEITLKEFLRFGEENEITIKVANTRTDRLGCVIRGFKGYSAGIYRGISIKVSGSGRIKDCYIQPIEGIQKLKWNVEIAGALLNKGKALLNWSIKNPKGNLVIAKGQEKVKEKNLEWISDNFGMRPWSDKTPNLYSIEFELCYGHRIIDSHRQTFGLRHLESDGVTLRLNETPVFLRGGTEHAYFPLTCTPPKDIETYKENIRRLKEIGFNWLRFHTWVPSREYMEAADELGMMIQVEPPLGFKKQEWLDILYTCRKHPSVVIYCCGNEELLDEEKIAELNEMANLCHEIVPDALFNPQEAMRGIEYYFMDPKDKERNINEPFPHNPERLRKVKEFSDVFGQYPLGLLSYSSVEGDWKVLDERLAIYKCPLLSHEICIHGNYINLDLEHRYEETRIGTEMFSSIRKNLKKEGLLSRASLYYNNSCAWMRILRKHTAENARKCKYIAGYDMLGAIDYNWHRSGYPCGVMNEFYELKPGESVDDVLKYNGESVLLLDCTNNRNLQVGDVLTLDLYSSLFGRGPLTEGYVDWYLVDDKHNIYQRAREKVENISNGKIEKLIEISLIAPEMEKPAKVTIYTRLTGGEYEIVNQWDFWVFPKLEQLDIKINPDSIIYKDYENLDGLRVIKNFSKEHLDFISGGGRAILLGSEPFKVLPTTFQLSITGRTQGNLATVIEEHPIIEEFPHDGFCDWQFYRMIEDGEAVLFNDLDTQFKPIIEMVSGYKLIKKQGVLFELCIGTGKLVVCTLNIKENDIAAMYLLYSMIKYAKSDKFQPINAISPDVILSLIEEGPKEKVEFKTDEALDPNVNKMR